MLIKNFITAAKDYGNYCPVKNELRVRRGRRVYRVSCGESELRLVTSGRPEYVIAVAPDVTVRELRRTFSLIADSRQTQRGGFWDGL